MRDEPHTTRRLLVRRDGVAALDAAAAAIFRLFLEREGEFGFNPAIVTEYPDIAAPTTSAFLANPAAYVDERVEALEATGAAVVRVTILTTFADRLATPLRIAGFEVSPIDMPAGPDFTAAFTQSRRAGAGRTLYLEAVNEADEKIRPTFALELIDGAGRLRGGACGSIHEKGGKRYAYLATMTLARDLPAGAGSRLGAALTRFLAEEGVDVVHLGTQTAGPFYEKLGYRVTTTVLRGLRVRQTEDGRMIATDLVMMEKILS